MSNQYQTATAFVDKGEEKSNEKKNKKTHFSDFDDGASICN